MCVRVSVAAVAGFERKLKALVASVFSVMFGWWESVKNSSGMTPVSFSVCLICSKFVLIYIVLMIILF